MRSTIFNRIRHLVVWALGTIFIANAVGCGESLPPTLPIEGQVSFRGVPLDSGTVTFHPQQIAEGLPRRPATGHLDVQGRFRLSTFRQGDGVLPGTYAVTVHSYKNQPTQDDDVATYISEWRIPSKYGDPTTSGLTQNISNDDGVIRIDLAE